jgi:hypothetical protein
MLGEKTRVGTVAASALANSTSHGERVSIRMRQVDAASLAILGTSGSEGLIITIIQLDLYLAVTATCRKTETAHSSNTPAYSEAVFR